MIIFITDWKLVAERKECEGSETNVGWKRTVADCADACRDKSSLFIFGTNDFGTNRCLLPCRGCKCFCENTSTFGICEQEIDHDGYRLYRFENDGNLYFETNLSFSYLKNYFIHII